MEGRLPPDDDDLFEWTDAPARPPREPERRETRERPRVERPEPEPPDTGAEDPLATGERRAVRDTRFPRGRRSDTEETRRVRGDTGEFERSGRRPPPGRRERHRDLPARVRRRQAFGIGAAAVVLIIALIVLISGGGGGSSEPTVGLKRLVGQTVVAKLQGAPSADLIRRVRKGEVGGLIVQPKPRHQNLDPQTVSANVRQLQEAASAGDNPRLLVMIDQEGGSVKRLPEGPPDVSPQQLGRSDDEGESHDQGQKTGQYLKGLGINVDLAPVLDVAQPQTADSIKSRTFGSDPSVVASVGVAFAQGRQDAGVAASPKHFPGLGRATVSTDDRAVSIAATTDQLQSDLEPFKSAIDADSKMIMVSTASYPTLGSRKQAAFSPAIVKGILRDQLGFDGVVITDDLEAPSVTTVTTPGLAATNAIEAGDDLLLFAKSDAASDKAFGSLITQVKRGHLSRGLLENAYDRITSLKENLE